MPPLPKLRKSDQGFTLAELLITLAILGVIATFTIPKVLSTQQNGSYNARAKEDIAMLSAAYTQALLAGNVSASTKPADLTPYMNYVQLSTSLTVDGLYNLGVSWNCAPSCLVLHNGSVVRFWPASFGGTSSTNAILFHIDPDGQYTSPSLTGPGKMIEVFIYYNGRVTTRGTIEPNTVSSDLARSPTPAYDPPWFSW